MIAPKYGPLDTLRYAEVYAADGAKIGSLARLQDQGSGMLHVEVSGFLTLCPAVLSLRIAQLRLRRDIDDALIIRVDLDKAAYVTLLYRQLRARATSPNLLSAWARWLQDAVRKPVSARR